MIHRMHSDDSKESDTRSNDGHAPSSGGRRSDEGAAFEDGDADSEGAEVDAVADAWGLAVDVGEEEAVVEEGDDVRVADDELAPEVVSRMRLLAVGAASAFARSRWSVSPSLKEQYHDSQALTLEVSTRTLSVVDCIVKEVVCVLGNK